MMLFFTDLHLALSKRLGWDEMPAKVAIPALDRIINNYVNVLFEVYGITSEDVDEECLQYDMLRIQADYLFGYLHIGSIDDCYDKESCHMFRFLREEIEHEMFNGMPYEAAIKEWFK